MIFIAQNSETHMNNRILSTTVVQVRLYLYSRNGDVKSSNCYVRLPIWCLYKLKIRDCGLSQGSRTCTTDNGAERLITNTNMPPERCLNFNKIVGRPALDHLVVFTIT